MDISWRRHLTTLTIGLCVLLALYSPKTLAEQVTFDESLRAAIERSDALAAQDELVTQAREHVRQARGSVLPSLSAEASYLTQETSKDPFAKEFFPKDQPTVNLSLTQPLFRGFREYAGLRRSKRLAEAQESQRDNTRLRVLTEAADRFFSVVSLEQEVKNLRTQAELFEERQSDLRQRTRVGLSSSTDALTTESAASALQAQLQETLGALSVARENFAVITGLGRDSNLIVPDLTTLSRTDFKLSDYLVRIEERPDIKAAHQRLQSAEETVKVARGAHLPSADLSGNYYFKRPAGPSEDINWDVKVSVTLPLYEGGVTQSRVREALSARTQAEIELRSARTSAEREIRSIHAEYQASLEKIRALEKAMSVSERNYRTLKGEYARGLTRNLDVLQALNSYQESRRALDRARYQAAADEICLRATANLPLLEAKK